MEEIGREPQTACSFFLKYQDKILFGKDTWSVHAYGFYYRMLETEDEYFPPLRKYPPVFHKSVLGAKYIPVVFFAKGSLQLFERQIEFHPNRFERDNGKV